MEIICYYCQGIIQVGYRQIYKVGDDFYVTYCPACDTENELWDVEDWFDGEEIEYIEKYHNIDERGDYD